MFAKYPHHLAHQALTAGKEKPTATSSVVLTPDAAVSCNTGGGLAKDSHQPQREHNRYCDGNAEHQKLLVRLSVFLVGHVALPAKNAPNTLAAESPVCEVSSACGP